MPDGVQVSTFKETSEQLRIHGALIRDLAEKVRLIEMNYQKIKPEGKSS